MKEEGEPISAAATSVSKWPHFHSNLTFNETRLIYASVPKTGSTTLTNLLL